LLAITVAVQADNPGQSGTTLTATKSATGHWTRTFRWTIDKSVSPDTLDLFVGESGEVQYTVTVTKDSGTDAAYVDGEICVTNGGSFATENLSIIDEVQYKVGGGQFQQLTTLAVDLSAKPVLAPGDSYCYPYRVDFTPAAGASYKNVAHVTITNHAGHLPGGNQCPGPDLCPFGPDPAADFSLPGTPTLVNDSINVDDSVAGFVGAFSGSGSTQYSHTFTCNGDRGPHQNIATIRETGQSDDAWVKVNCYEPAVSKTAGGRYDERHEWDITKSVDPTDQSAFAGETVGYEWTVTVTEHVFEENFGVTGGISVTNPHPSADMVVSLSDVLSDGTGATITGCNTPYSAGLLTVPAHSTATCGYSAAPGGHTATGNTATVTLNGYSFPASAEIVWAANVINGSATVSDNQNPGFPLTISDGGTWTYAERYTCSSNPQDYTGGSYTFPESNIARVAYGNTVKEAPASTAVRCYAPVVVKTAAGTYDERHDWDIDKVVSPTDQSAFAGATVGYKWQVTLTETVTEEHFNVSGTITVKNPNPDSAMTVSLSDILNDGTTGTITADADCAWDGTSLVVPAGGTATCDYSADPNDRSALSNRATATLNDIAFNAAADVTWTANVINPTVTVKDNQNPDFPQTVSDGATWTYGEEYVCSRDTADYGDDGTYDFSEHNTATVSAGDTVLDSASADTTVHCYTLLVSKTARTSYTRTWTWNIVKKADQTSLTLAKGQPWILNYSVTVSGSSVDSDHTVSGIITISNPNLASPVVVPVNDSLSGAVVDCGGGSTIATIPAGGSAECSYSAGVGGAASGTNTASVTLNAVTSSGSADYSFGAPGSEIDECVTVSDTYQGSPVTGQLCGSGGSFSQTFDYQRTISFSECGDYTVDNTATFTANDTSATGSAAWTVNVHVPCGGCTLTVGYWKTHSLRGPAPYDDTWALVGGVDATFLWGKSYYTVLWTAPAGNAWYILAHQYIAAYMNSLNGADTTAINTQLAQAYALLSATDPASMSKVKGSVKAQFTSLAATLDSYNNGLIGPGHCSE
jgi:hypothetical protein